ncbi:MAG: response regulator [Deltaproteobacteria bacterium]|nr:response regulator [Deltaproteobacteria bacterium]MBW2070910.1 response regulator [Deltaproteobacteria bacterium]
MLDPIFIVDANSRQRAELCSFLELEHYRSVAVGSLGALEKGLKESGFQLVILDLDTLQVDNRFLRTLIHKNPRTCVIATSTRSFHPELKEAFSTHISVCLSKPLDLDELLYWIKAICESRPSSRDSPQ